MYTACPFENINIVSAGLKIDSNQYAPHSRAINAVNAGYIWLNLNNLRSDGIYIPAYTALIALLQCA